MSSEENVSSAPSSATVPAGPESMLVCGASVLTVKVCDGGVESALPAASTARTSKVCEPCERSR